MSVHSATVVWNRGDSGFTDQRYSRRHLWRFDGGAEIVASASPHVVPAPLSDPAGVDPEEAFIASISSCHMLWFLSLAAAAGFVVDSYEDAAEGTMARNEAGQMWVDRVVLRPAIVYSGSRPSADEEQSLHHEAHDKCFIANSVRTTISVAPL
jgi:organic hydroperoxide reductase OsmC/OhrA